MSKELITKILKASEEIGKASRVNSANYIVTSSYVAKVFQDIEKYEKRKRIINKLLKGDS